MFSLSRFEGLFLLEDSEPLKPTSYNLSREPVEGAALADLPQSVRDPDSVTKPSTVSVRGFCNIL